MSLSHGGRQQAASPCHKSRELEQDANYWNASSFGLYVLVVHQQLSFDCKKQELKQPEGIVK